MYVPKMYLSYLPSCLIRQCMNFLSDLKLMAKVFANLSPLRTRKQPSVEQHLSIFSASRRLHDAWNHG